LRKCVFTTLIGGYERLNEQPVASSSNIPFICLTDDPSLVSGTWQIRRVATTFEFDAVRSQREIKLRPHRYLDDYDASLYIDNSVLLNAPPELVFEHYFVENEFCLPEHSFRDSVTDEFLAVSDAQLDDQTRLFEQLNHYALECPEALEERPYWTAILLRNHRNAAVREALDLWAAHVHRYSRRDQLSANVAFRRANYRPNAFKIDNHRSWFHSWPHTEGRDRDNGIRRLSYSLTPLVGRLRQMEQDLSRQKAAFERRLAELEQLYEKVLSEKNQPERTE